MPSITIKIKPYLQEFIKSRLNETADSSLKDIIGATLLPFIESMPKGVVPVMDHGDEFMEIDLVHINSRHGADIRGNLYISAKNQSHLERILTLHFDDLFFQFVDDKRRYDVLLDSKRFNKGQLKLIILQFCAENNIPFNHLNYEMLKKKYYRKEKKKSGALKNVYRKALLVFV